MTTLIVDELKTSLTQPFTVSKRINATAVKLYLLKQLSPAGTFTASIKQGVTTLGSKGLTSADIEAGDANITSINYAHSWIVFTFTDNVVLSPGVYDLVLTASGYTFTESSYIGWVVPHEDLITNISYTPAHDLENPYGFQIWEYKEF